MNAVWEIIVNQCREGRDHSINIASASRRAAIVAVDDCLRAKTTLTPADCLAAAAMLVEYDRLMYLQWGKEDARIEAMADKLRKAGKDGKK